MKIHSLRRLFLPFVALCASLLHTGCSTIRNTPVLGDLLPDLTNPAELRDAAELAGVLVLQNNPDHVAALRDAVLRAETALQGELISQADFDGWVSDLLGDTISDPLVRVFVRQRFDKAWAANHDLLNVSGLVLKNAKHRELAEAFIGGLKNAVEEFADAAARVRAASPDAAHFLPPTMGQGLG